MLVACRLIRIYITWPSTMSEGLAFHWHGQWLTLLTSNFWGTLRHRMVGTFPVPSFGYYCWSPKGGQAGRVVKSVNLGLTSWRVAAGPEWSGHRAGGQWGASACRSDSPGYAAFFVPKLDDKKFKQTRCCSVGGMNYDVWSSPPLVHGPGRTFTQPYGPQLSPLGRAQRGLHPLGRHSSPGSWSVKKSNHHHPLHLPVKLTILGKLTTVQTDCSPSSYPSPY